MTIRIAIAKGALFEGALNFLKAQGIELPESELVNNRKLILQTNNPDYEILRVRGHDVPIYVEHGAADLGIVGYDVIIDSLSRVVQLEDLNYGHCRLCVCAPKGMFSSITSLPNNIRVTTSFPNITKDYFQKLGIDVEIIKLYGSVELGPLTSLSDIIVDLVASGKTLEENGLEVVAEIMACSSRLIANESSFKFNKESFLKLSGG